MNSRCGGTEKAVCFNGKVDTAQHERWCYRRLNFPFFIPCCMMMMRIAGKGGTVLEDMESLTSIYDGYTREEDDRREEKPYMHTSLLRKSLRT